MHNTSSVGEMLRLLCLFGLFLDLGHSLNKYVDNFETLNYRPVLDRRKRSLSDSNSPIDLRFRSHNRTFHLKLYPIERSSDVFADDYFLDVNGEYQSHVIRPHDFLYQGYIKDDPSSVVYGSILDGVFDGHIITGDGASYTVEKAARYFEAHSRPNYHSFIYPDDSINHRKFRTKRSTDDNDVEDEHADEGTHGCGLSKPIREDMLKVQQSAVREPGSIHYYDEPVRHRSHLVPDEDDFSFPNRYLNRSRRDVRNAQVKDINGHRVYSVRTCSIYMQADQKLYEHIFYKEGNRDHVRTREEIVSLFYNHIKAVNQIYETTDFGGVLGLNFVIQRTTIYTNQTCVNGRPAPGSDNPFCEDNVDVSNFLNLNSQRNHSAFCLAYALTFRDFVGGTLGLAWVASPNFNTAGGICQVYQKYNEGSRGMVYRSLNTGIITLVNYGNRVPARVSQLTLAHEIGHNFGSPHDFPAECQPGLPDGNYIMFASATSGDKVNNARFSPCSVANISLVLYEVLQQTPVDPSLTIMPLFGKKRNCFQGNKQLPETSAFCGNQIREPGEECDCGFSDRDCRQMADRCCQPHEIGGRYFGAGACKRVRGAACSPSEGQCCNAASCSFYLAYEKRRCREESECLYSQECDGTGPECPESKTKPDGLPCQDATKVCQFGSCNGSICAEVGLKDCFLTEGKPAELCHLACEKDGRCVSSFDLPEFGPSKFFQAGRAGQPGLLLHPGSPCNNYKGYCDIFRKCRSVDANGPLARLKNLLFNKQTIKSVSQWAHEHWWACVLIGIGVLLFMALFVKCCAVHTPSTNPNKLPAQAFSETLRHPGTLLRRGRHARAHGVAYSVGPPPVPPAGERRDRRHRHGGQRAASAGAPANAAAAHHHHSGGANRAPPNQSAPPLIQPVTSSPQQPSTSAQPPSAPPTNEPPPPYTPVDPSSVLSPPIPAPVSLPGPPPPAMPLVPGPPVSGQGPKPGRRPKRANSKDTPTKSGSSGSAERQRKPTKRSAK